ncbi:adhesion G protein-coupled receptor A2 [Spea bombifrons]|uniref:adhesion G protein-coupled receptor A2 n=1 Tax=Spea bombifrons TaxID=233779 RepID=UPI0023492A4E|nr:adhesion G protein-coupled receptor A2 [Spea bombifrons]
MPGLMASRCYLRAALLFLCLVPCTLSCPVLIHSCKCVAERPKLGVGSAGAPRKKVVCTNEDLLEVPDPALLPNRTVTLILTNNKITVLRNGSFYGLHDLEKLDLKNNLISKIEPGAFLGLSELKRLDISNNRIGCVNPAAFQGLSSLTRLIMSGNIFSSLNPGVFDEMPSLKVVDLASEYLTCDCNLRWLASWTRNGSAQVSDRTLCVYPSALRDRPLRNLKENQLHCEGTPELHTHHLIPSLRQVVFQGDRLPIQCTASYMGNRSQVIWYHNGKQVEEDEELGIILEDTIIHDCTYITSELILSNIHLSANGEWECIVATEHGNVSKKVELVVLETSASYCPAERVSNNRGDFRWPRTLAGITSYQTCPPYPFTAITLNDGMPERKASRRCDRSGHWEEGDYSNCQYTNDITNVLYRLAKMHINASNVLSLAHQLQIYTAEAATFSDMMDVIYVAQIMEKFVRQIDHVKQLAEVMLEMASNIMQVDDHILWMAQVEDKACSSIVQTVEKIAGLTLSSNSQDLSVSTRNIALEAYLIKPHSFVGLSCTAYQRRGGHRQEIHKKEGEADFHSEQRLKFRCTTGQGNISLPNFHVKNSLALASVHLPPSLFMSTSSPSCKLQVLSFRNGKLFRSVGNSSRLAEDGKRRSISTPVIYVGTRDCGSNNLTDPVTVTLRHLVKGSNPLPAKWNFKSLEGYGSWSSEGCRLLSEEPNITSMQCQQLGNFAILTELNTFSEPVKNGTEVLHPVIYSCTAILLLCLFTTIITYIVHHSSIQISRKGWHMLLNLCFHIAMTSAVFAGGINLTGYLVVCQAVSIILHYSSLSTLLWMSLKARVIYKELTHKPQPQPEGEAVQTPQRPMLRFYLIAGGIPLIICGITAAVNINNYRENNPYCCLVWRPSLGAFYVPAALILLVTWIYLLCAGINLKRQPTDQKDPLEPSDPHQQPGGISHLLSDSSSISVTINSASPPTDVDAVYSLHVQFWALVIVHVLYIVLWIFGALAVSQDWYFNVIFSCFYGVTAVVLGIFMFLHHCVRRQDVKSSWFACCPRYIETLPTQAYVQTGSPVDDSPQVFMGCNPELTNSVKSSSSPSSSSHSNNGPCKITNLQVAQNQVESCSPKPPSCEDSEPTNNKNITVPSRYMNNLHGRRNHKSRTKQYREGKHHRLKVLRGPSSDLPSSESGSIHNSHSESYNSRHSPLNNGRAGVVVRDPEGALTHSEGSDSSGHQTQDFARAQRKSASRDNLKQANSMERETKRRSYPLNTANQNGVLKGSEYDINLATTENSATMKTGLWKSETTV